MIEILLASAIIGSTEIAPNVLQVEYLTPMQQVITVLENTELEGGQIDHD